MTPTNILVPVDFSAHSERALDYACSLAEKLGAKLHLVHAIGAGLPELNAVITDSMLAKLREGSLADLTKIASAREGIATFGRIMIEPGDARDGILEAARACAADLIVIGSHGRRGLSRLVLGSVAEDIARRAPCPVLVVRLGESS
jgi:nucleotide-binding universal stress UspA family protein